MTIIVAMVQSYKDEMTYLLYSVMECRHVANDLLAFMGVKRHWLEAAFAEVDRRYGNFDNYISEFLLLSEQDIDTLKANLLENAI